MNTKALARQHWVWLGAALLLLLALFAPRGGAPGQQGEISTGGLALRAGGSLLLVLGILLGAAHLVRRYGLPASLRAGTDGRLKIEEKLGLAGRQAVYVLCYGPHRFLVASDQQGLKLLTRIPRRRGSRVASADERLG